MNQIAGQYPGYVIRERIDSPRHYEWYFATDESDRERWYFIKSLSRELCNTAELRLYYQECCRREAHVHVDGIFPIQEIGQSRTHGVYVVYPYFMPFLRLGEINAIFQREHRTLPSMFNASVLLDAVRILEAAHAQQLDHFSLFPHNVLLMSNGEVYVHGFIEAAMRRRFRFESELNEKCDAPEVRRCEGAGVESDVYVVGAMLYQWTVNAYQPDEWEPRWMGMMDSLNRSSIPGESLALVMQFFQKALAERPEQRFTSYGMLAQALERVITEVGYYVPKEVRAELLDGYFDEYPPVLVQEPRSETDRSGVINLITGDSPSLSIDVTSACISERVGYVDGVRNASMNGISGTFYGGVQECAGREEPELSAGRVETGDTLAFPVGGVETRILHKSSGSFRTIAPSLRSSICQFSPLEILSRSRYQILGELGKGGTGTVYKVLDTTLAEVLALKVLKPELVADSAWLQRFKRELKITRDLEHKNILQAYHLEQLEGLYFYTMKCIDGCNLSELLREESMPMMMALRILMSVGLALAAAHEQGVIHRDLKPANIMIEKATYHPYLMDFGIASTQDSMSLTLAGQGIGTPSYMAPEQSRGEPITVQADIYSFGVMAYECFTLRLPYSGTTPIAIYTAQMSGIFQPIRDINPSVPEHVAHTIERCLSPKAQERPANMSAVLSGLRYP